MLNILLVVFFAASVLNLTLFGGAVFWSILAALLSLGLLGFRLLFAAKIKPALIRPISLIGVAALVAVGFWCGLRPAEGGFVGFESGVAEVERYLAQDEAFKAGEAWEELRELYGNNDTVRLLEARIAMEKKEYDTAVRAMDALSDRRQEPYYATVGQIRVLQKNYDQALAVYIEGAKTWPLWSDMQLIAGVQASDNKQYQVAEYFLLRAAEQMPRNPVPLYHLGVARFEQGYAEEADVYFNEALSLGLDEERTGYVAWYRQQMEGDKK